MTARIPFFVEAITTLQAVMRDARKHREREAAAAHAPESRDARPSVRMVNVVRVAESGLRVFSSNGGKGRHLLNNLRALQLRAHSPGACVAGLRSGADQSVAQRLGSAPAQALLLETGHRRLDRLEGKSVNDVPQAGHSS